eukprot:NODE_4667_length_762_cov_58.351181_g4644_i0.p2 GENE.NODE_4667_length_762_cov_58.351181_g4644_i0~~NODE_4667_length_762_cov_58.351181_g4644_i0.p2  ORF type:complete len:130 (+),score=27.71 NODE_4667_length_762_cov_58.351181_g4644_i0:166-555(+)
MADADRTEEPPTKIQKVSHNPDDTAGLTALAEMAAEQEPPEAGAARAPDAADEDDATEEVVYRSYSCPECSARDTGEMVQCDRCKEWYHFACQPDYDPDMPEEDEFFCAQCIMEDKKKGRKRKNRSDDD